MKRTRVVQGQRNTIVSLNQNIVMPTKNLRLVLVLLSQFKVAEENNFHFCIWKVL